jgi:hypothetical protein
MSILRDGLVVCRHTPIQSSRELHIPGLDSDSSSMDRAEVRICRDVSTVVVNVIVLRAIPSKKFTKKASAASPNAPTADF